MGFTESEAEVIATFNNGIDTELHGVTHSLGETGKSWHENTVDINNSFSWDNINYVPNSDDDWHLNLNYNDRVYGRIYSNIYADLALRYFDIDVNQKPYESFKEYRLKELALYNENDSRIKLAEIQLQYAKDLMDYANQNYKDKDASKYDAVRNEALIHIGMGLHAVQDVIAHQYPSNQGLITSHYLSVAKIQTDKGYELKIIAKLPDNPEYDYITNGPLKGLYIPGTLRSDQVTNNTNKYLKIAHEIIYN